MKLRKSTLLLSQSQPILGLFPVLRPYSLCSEQSTSQEFNEAGGGIVSYLIINIGTSKVIKPLPD